MTEAKLFERFISKQSLASFTHNKAHYVECKPCDDLQGYINCYWCTPALPGFVPQTEIGEETIIPDGCVDIIFDINIESGEYQSIVIGMASQPIQVSSFTSGIQTYGIRFNPGGAYPVFKTEMKAFSDSWAYACDVIPKLEKKLYGIFSLKIPFREKIRVLNSIFMVFFDHAQKSHTLYNVLSNIILSKGTMHIKDLAKSECISERHLSRLFNQWLGHSSKMFSQVVKFQNTLEVIRTQGIYNMAQIAADAGYYDQSHFIRHFKAFTGKNISDFFNVISCPIFPIQKG
ncbi:MAG: helix-turn-helix domain-containing protein [Clostridia bacterium]|nr:helix-turn-helix domain-containing protein [Clostridia bacterium]